MPLGGGVWPFCSIVHLYGKIIVHLRGKSTKFGMVIVLTLLNNGLWTEADFC